MVSRHAIRAFAWIVCLLLVGSGWWLHLPGGRALAQDVPVEPPADFDDDGLSDADEAVLQTDPRRPDTDRDGLVDGWEVNGVTRHGLFEPLHHLDANPLVQDVFIEIDWMETADGDPWHNAAIAYRAAIDIARVFEDSDRGIRVHFDLGPDIESHVAQIDGEEGPIPDFSDFGRGPTSERIIPYRESFPTRPDCSGRDPHGSLYDLYNNENYFRPSRRNVFYYLVIAERHGDPELAGRPGFTDNFANEAARRDGLKPTGVHVGVIYRQALEDKSDSEELRRYKFSVSLLHELGHCMGLGHGGSTVLGRWDNRNFKPNYPSVMNHLYQFRGVDEVDGLPVPDFSRGRFFDLQETRLYEARGVGPTVPNDHLLRIWNVAHLESSKAPFNLDWNGNGQVDLDYLRRDLNADGRLDDSPFTDHDDWGKLVRDGFAGIGVNSHNGCGLTCQRAFEIIRLPGDFNGDGLPDMALFSGRSLSLALGNPDGRMRVPRSRVFTESIGDWRPSYDDQIVIGRFGGTQGDKLLFQRDGRAALVDFNLQGAETVWTGSRLGDENSSWSFSSVDSVLPIRLPDGTDAALAWNRSEAAVLRWEENELAVVWRSNRPLGEWTDRRVAWFETGRSSSTAGCAWLRSESSLSELTIGEETIDIRRHDDGGVILPLSEDGVGWKLSQADCMKNLDLNGDGDVESVIFNRTELAVLEEDVEGLMRVAWSTLTSGRPWEEGGIDNLLVGSFRGRASDEIVVVSHPEDTPTESSAWRALAWFQDGESAELRTIAEAKGTVDATGPEPWTLRARQFIVSGTFESGRSDLLLVQDAHDLAFIALEGGESQNAEFRTRAVSRARVGGWSISPRDRLIVSHSFLDDVDLPLLKNNDFVASIMLEEGLTSSIDRIETSSMMLRPAELFLRGDSNRDGEVDLSDALTLLIFMFQGGQALPCPDAGDTDDSGELDISDAVRLLNRLFLGGVPIPLPGVLEPGTDPSPDELGCNGER